MAARGLFRVHPGACALRIPSQRSMSQEAVLRRESGVTILEGSTLDDEDNRSALRNGSQSQEEERQSWQDVAADREKVGEPPKKSKEMPPKLYEDDQHGIRGVHIPRSAWLVLLKLRAAGHEGYVVGGAVRDLLLKGQPKDFDILTTATIFQVKNLLHRSRLIGKRFPIVQVVVDGDMMEVSSFSTGVPLTDLPFDAAALLGNRRVQLGNLSSSQGEGLLWRDARRQNALARDFTVNALMYDPFSRVIFDYTGGVLDCRKGTLRSIIDPKTSFARDPARIMRAVRLAARAGLKVDEATGKAIRSEQNLLLDLPQGRLVMEMHALLAYGAASETMKLLWRYELLELVFPLLAEYLTEMKYPKSPRKPKPDRMFEVLTRMDQKATPEYPLAASVWTATLVGFMAAHTAAKATGVPDATVPPQTKAQRRKAKRKKAMAEAFFPAHKKSAAEVSSASTHPAGLPAAKSFSADDHELKADMELLGLQPSHAPAALSGETDDEDAAQSLEDETEPYMKIVISTLDAFIDSSRAKCVSKAQRLPILNLLRSERNHRLNANQTLKLKCGSCKTNARVEVSATTPKCDKCGHSLPTKRLKMARRPELMTVIDALQPCFLDERKAS